MDVSQAQVREAPIMIVDDSMMSLREIETILRDAGFRNLTLCSDPGEVVDRYRLLDPALVILDYYMPEMSGEDVLDSLKAEYPDKKLSVLFWTSASEADLYTRALRKGARDVLRKENVREQEIVSRVHNLVESQLYYRKLHERNERLNEEVKRRTRQLEKTSLETIGRLSRAAEFRDNETGGHIERIGLLTRELAEKLGIDDSICEAIRYAAPMHDIGKIGVPDEILFKPGDLDDTEWDTMKKHSRFGAKILDGSEQHYLQLGKNIAHYHHERWDGTGYPGGLRHGEIPVEARITAVCDVFDALLSDRPYKDPWPVDRTLDLIEEEKGEQFDPDVADCFLEHADRMLEIRGDVDSSPSRNVMPDLPAASAG